ncbi:MAG: alginate lyase family protein [Phycisphaerae bacterium]|nr:alginate lyase family protein [Phycisphaerae bacterium]
MRSRLTQAADRCVAVRRRRLPALEDIAGGNGESVRFDGRLAGHVTGAESEASSRVAGWREELIDRAERLCRNRVSLFECIDCDLGSEVNWNFEYEVGQQTPMRPASSIDYRDHAEAGDAKIAWEPSRHQHLAVLGRAYRLTGDDRYAAKVVEQILSWIEQCPFGVGMQWRSPLELAVRVINWSWALALIDGASCLSSGVRRTIIPAAYRHLWEIARKYSRFSSANNHRIGEAAGVYIGSRFFRSIGEASTWAQEAKAILCEEMERQVLPDGGHAERATGYHLFCLEFLLYAGLVGRRTGDDFPPAYWARLERMFEFVAALAEGGESLPMFNDADDGHVLRLCARSRRVAGLLAIGAVLFERGDFKALADDCGEPVFWMLGAPGLGAFDRLDADAAPATIFSRAFPETGVYVLQSGGRGGDDRISVTLDCGILGFGAIAAHGHADALSLTLRAFGVDVLVDPGTYDYFTDPRWRDYFRSTRAHNTVVVDDVDQSESLGPFLWGRRANTRCLRWEPATCGGTVAAEHDGYERLVCPVRHRRTVSLNAERREITVVDELRGVGVHRAMQCWHFGERCDVRRAADRGHLIVECPKGIVRVELDDSLEVGISRGEEEPIAGWVSRAYHQRMPAWTVVGRRDWGEELKLTTRFVVGECRSTA